MESIVDIEILKNIVDYGVIGLLGFMSFLSFWLYIERLLFYKNIDIKNYSKKNN